MSILSMCQWLQDTNIGTSIRESIWVFPIIETIHVLALSISVGFCWSPICASWARS